MGINYYLYEKPCDHCGREDQKKHIGKCSGGWCFLLHIIPDEGINDIGDWILLFHNPEYKIRNEYDEAVTTEEMVSIITARSRETPVDWSKLDNHETQYCEPGPNNLRRSKIDGRRCTGHGAGTWDLMLGEFS